MRKLSLQKILENIKKEEKLEEKRKKEEEDQLKSRPWANFFGELDYDPCADVKRPENIPDEIFYKVMYLSSQWECWYDDPEKKELDAAWAAISALNATGRHGEGLFDLA